MSIPTNKDISKILYNSTNISIQEEHPIEISTDAGMAAVLTTDNIGRCYKFIGTTGTYVNGDLYVVEDYIGPLCFTANADTDIAFTVTGTLTTTPVIQYSLDGMTWNSYTFGNTVSLTSGESCYWRGDNDSFSESDENYITFSSTGSVAASGNIMSLLDSTCASTIIPCSYCYYYMFNGCTSLTTAPALPATTLAYHCYSVMFYDCTSLTTAPSLPATTLASYCYGNMFRGCTSLTTAPSLPATTLASNCYQYMFRGCSSLQVYSSSGTGHTQAWTIPTSGTASSYTSQSNMFYGTTGDYASTSSVTLNATFYTQNEPVA